MTDDEILKNREELQRRLPPDCRTDAANKHVEAMEVAGRIARCPPEKRKWHSIAYYSFLNGWDSAMEIRSEELLREHEELHGRIMDIEMEKLRKERGM
jgi:hypothetical protein